MLASMMNTQKGFVKFTERCGESFTSVVGFW